MLFCILPWNVNISLLQYIFYNTITRPYEARSDFGFLFPVFNLGLLVQFFFWSKYED